MAFAASCTMMCGVSVWNPSGIGFVIICLSFEYLDEEEDFFVRKKNPANFAARPHVCTNQELASRGAGFIPRNGRTANPRWEGCHHGEGTAIFMPTCRAGRMPGNLPHGHRFASVKTSALSIHHGWIRMNTDAI